MPLFQKLLNATQTIKCGVIADMGSSSLQSVEKFTSLMNTSVFEDIFIVTYTPSTLSSVPDSVEKPKAKKRERSSDRQTGEEREK